MKVNGNAFKKAREQLRKKHADEPVLRGEPAVGTQEWLASVATYTITDVTGEKKSIHPTVKTIQNLENKGVASLPVILALSIPLRINGYELIQDYGKDSVVCQTPGVVDFRPLTDLRADPLNYYKSSFLVTVDPIVIKFENEDIDRITLTRMELMLRIGELRLKFKWLYDVSLIPSKPWLGVNHEVGEVELSSPCKYRSSIMFKQDGSSMLWIDFIEIIRKTDEKQINLDVKLFFEHFHKEVNIIVSVVEIRHIFDMAKVKYSEYYEKYNLYWPRFLQPNALTLG